MILLYENIFNCLEEIEAAKSVGFKVQDFDIRNCWIGDLPSEPFIFRGSLEGLVWFDRMDHPYYCRMSNIKNYAINEYICGFDRFLNNDFILLPAGKVKESKDMLFNLFGGDRIFIKPNSGNKLFTGTYLSKKWFEKDLNIVYHELSRSDVMLSDLIFLSSYKEVGEETRYVINNDMVLTDLEYPNWLADIAKECFMDDDYYTIDIAGDKIVEINCMSCSGLNDSFETIYKNMWDFYAEH